MNDLAFDPCYQRVTSDQNIQSELQAIQDLYVYSGEIIPPHAPKTRVKPVQVNCFVDSDHAGEIATQLYQTGIILYCKLVPIIWYSKWQNKVEISTFGEEFVAL